MGRAAGGDLAAGGDATGLPKILEIASKDAFILMGRAAGGDLAAGRDLAAGGDAAGDRKSRKRSIIIPKMRKNAIKADSAAGGDASGLMPKRLQIASKDDFMVQERKEKQKNAMRKRRTEQNKRPIYEHSTYTA